MNDRLVPRFILRAARKISGKAGFPMLVLLGSLDRVITCDFHVAFFLKPGAWKKNRKYSKKFFLTILRF